MEYGDEKNQESKERRKKEKETTDKAMELIIQNKPKYCLLFTSSS